MTISRIAKLHKQQLYSFEKRVKANMKELIKTNTKYKSAAKALKEGLSLRKTAAFAGISINTVRKIKDAID